MNYKILQRVLDELNKETPKLDYIRGMVETLLSLQDNPKVAPLVFSTNDVKFTPNQSVSKVNQDEGAMLDAIARANFKTVSELAKKSSE